MTKSFEDLSDCACKSSDFWTCYGFRFLKLPGDRFRWFCVESGSADNPSVILIHGFPSQAYSYRKVLPVLSKDYHVIAFDWLGFGFSDKPQPRYGFDYTLDGNCFSGPNNLLFIGNSCFDK
eukprot:XP_014628753.1 uncharacterized hydrolase YNR064C-like [Glycine max]